QGLDIREFANVLSRRRHTLLAIPIMAAVIVGAISLLVEPTFTAVTTFVPEARPQSSTLPSSLVGLAGQLGVSLGGEASQSPRFYAEVIKSRELLERILLAHYQDPAGNPVAGDSVTLLRILRVRGKSLADSLQEGVKELDKRITGRADNQTNIVRLSVESHYPTIAALVANRIVEYLNEFNTKTRQSQARERRKFVEARIADGDRDLRQAEDELRGFYEMNRSWQQSPQLVFEEGRLRRQLDIHQEVYLTLRREYETARIEEVNDTPVITVIDVAVPPQKKSKPKRSLLVLLSLMLGTIASAVWVVGETYLRRQIPGP